MSLFGTLRLGKHSIFHTVVNEQIQEEKQRNKGWTPKYNLREKKTASIGSRQQQINLPLVTIIKKKNRKNNN